MKASNSGAIMERQVGETMTVQGCTLVLTCSWNPEQYDVFASNGDEIGYLRLRHGGFTADYTFGVAEDDEKWKCVYSSEPKGHEEFADDIERTTELNAAVSAILAAHAEATT